MAAGSYPDPDSGPVELPRRSAGVRLPGVANGSDHAELSSLRSQLEEVTGRIVAVADRYRDTTDSAITAELDAAERNLLTARRAVERALAALT
jgi:hypothetical protein